jgi:hypothetical protein
MPPLRCSAFLLLLVGASPLVAQKVKLNKTLSGVIDTTWMNVERHPNIFEKHSWLQPEIKSVPFEMTYGGVEVEVGGRVMHITGDEDAITVSVDGRTASATATKCTTCYPDRSALRVKPVVTTMWVPVTTYVMQSHMVPRTRQVTRYQYNSSTRSSQPVYSTETYYTTEFRSVPQTRYEYRQRTTYVLDIPRTTIFALGGLIEHGDNYFVYAPQPGSDTWYVQHTSFLLATSADDIHYVMIDSDADGNFLGPDDHVAFNTWNPYAESSRYRGMRRFIGNRWYSCKQLEMESFIRLRLSDDMRQVIGRDLNHEHYGNKDFGELSIAGLPDDAELVINGARFPARKLTKPLRCQYGYYQVHLKRPGHLDQVQIIHPNAQKPHVTIQYEESAQAMDVHITNIFSQNYFVHVTGADGYHASHYNAKEFMAPLKPVKLSIENEGYTWEGEFDLAQLDELVIDYEAEIKKHLAEGEPDAPAEDAGKEDE